MKNKILCGIASLPERKDNLQRTLETLYDQVDEFHIVLNNYSHTPSFLQDNKYIVYHRDNSVGAAMKFLGTKHSNSYYFSCDDDLLYPYNYVKTMMAKCAQYSNKIIVTAHGGILLNSNIHNKYRLLRKGYHFARLTPQDQWVHIGGTGVMCFHQPTIKVTMKDFSHKNKADYDMFTKAQKKEIPILVIQHPKSWIKYQKDVIRKFNIYRHKKNSPVEINLCRDIIRKTGEIKLHQA